MKRIFYVLLAALLIGLGGWQAQAADGLEDLNKRVEKLEKIVEATEVVDDDGHKLHPIHSIYGLRVSGGVTMSAHGVDSHSSFDQRGEGALSADLVVETPIGSSGRAVVVLDFQRGAGLANLPSFFTAPNGNPTGYNADLESFNNDSAHLTQAYYEHDVSDRLVVSVGQLDITGYIDANEYANDELAQYMANTFVNNPTIEFGGSDDFYALGLRASYSPVDAVELTVAAFEGDGDYADTFDSPFILAEAAFKLAPMGREGNYRVYYWSRQKRPDASNTANPADATLADKENAGVGISIDQTVTDSLGVWLRAGVQRESVAQFDRHVSLGANYSGANYGRPHDMVGVAYGVTLMGTDFENYQKTLNADI